ncbi:MAG: riboflavin kinase [Patescibacteria group bacterium]
MKIVSHKVKGKGRGKLLGYPTINLEIPEGCTLQEGIWAAWVTIRGKRYAGALHFGPVPTFAEEAKSLEVFLLDVTEAELVGVEKESIELTAVTRLRDILTFDTPEALARQIAQDVKEIRKLLTPQ